MLYEYAYVAVQQVEEMVRATPFVGRSPTLDTEYDGLIDVNGVLPQAELEADRAAIGMRPPTLLFISLDDHFCGGIFPAPDNSELCAS